MGIWLLSLLYALLNLVKCLNFSMQKKTESTASPVFIDFISRMRQQQMFEKNVI